MLCRSDPGFRPPRRTPPWATFRRAAYGAALSDGGSFAASVLSSKISDTDMTKLELIEQEIRSLSAGELAQLRTWFFELDAEQWDKEIERDAASGKLASFSRSL